MRVIGIGIGYLLWLILWLGLSVGYVMNVVKFCQCDFKESYKAEIIRGVGMVAMPVGGVMGWLSIADGNEVSSEK